MYYLFVKYIAYLIYCIYLCKKINIRHYGKVRETLKI